MLRIIPASDMTAAKVQQFQLVGENKLMIVEEIKRTLMFETIIERLVFYFIHEIVPNTALKGLNSYKLSVDPSQYNMPSWLCYEHPELLLQTIVGELMFQLEPHGYKLTIPVSGYIQISW